MQAVASVRTLFAVVGMLSTAVPVRAQMDVHDEGTFEIMVNGRVVGSEEFSIRQTGVGPNAEFIATGHVEVLLPTGRLELTPRLRSTGFQADPASYDISIGGDSPRRIAGTVGAGRFTARIVTPVGEQLREYLASPGSTVIDEGIAHQYYFLARRTRSGRVPILIPRESRQVMAEVTDLGEEQLTINGTTANLYHLLVVPDGGDERHVWVDALGRVIKVEIPDRNYVAERTEVPR